MDGGCESNDGRKYGNARPPLAAAAAKASGSNMVESVLVAGVFIEDMKFEFWVGLEWDEDDADDLCG